MPAKRKRISSARKLVKRKRGAASSSYRRTRYRKPLALKPHTFCERSTITTMLNVKQTPAVADGLIKEFSLNEIAQSGSYVDLFEEYQINKVVVNFRYKGIGSIAANQAAAGWSVLNEVNPILYFKVDANDENLESLDVLKQSSKCREHQFTNSSPNFSIVLKPACLVDVGNIHGALGVAHRPKWRQWLPMEESAISHFGLKAYVVGSSGGQSPDIAGQVEVTYKIYFTAKNNE